MSDIWDRVEYLTQRVADLEREKADLIRDRDCWMNMHGMVCEAYDVDRERFIERGKQIAALQRTQVPRWVSVEERFPEDQQTVAFVMSAKDGAFKSLNGRVLGGRYIAGLFGGFSIPGFVVNATYWMPLPPPPEEQNSGSKNHPQTEV